MAAFICFIIGISTILFSKYLFGKWFNHLFFYAFSWMVFTTLYELKLIRFITISFETWIIIISSFLFFILGILTVFAINNHKPSSRDNTLLDYLIENKDLIQKNINYLLLIFVAIGLLSAILHWYVLVKKFGSIPAVLVQANIIYKLRVEGNLEGGIPYINAFSYAAVFLGGLLTSLKGKLTFRATFPLMVIIFEGIASAGRAGIFLAFVEFTLTYVYFRHLLSKRPDHFPLNKTNITISVVVVLILFIGSTTIIKSARKTFENYKASTQTLKDLESTYIITPSLYFYFSSNIGVLSKYFEHGGEKFYFGENTLLPFYNLLAKLDLIPQPQTYPKGYFIPLWSNSATYLRDLHEDYGYFGVFLAPFALGFFCTFLWFRFFENGTLFNFIILIYLNLIVAFSTFYIVTRAAVWYISFLILIFSFFYLLNRPLNIIKT